MSLIIKITQNGSSQEYIFNKLGPIIIGSDSRCDLRLDDSHIESKMLEVKVSGGNIFVKELGVKSQIYINSVILPFREEIRYQEGECISLRDTNYQIHIQKVQTKDIEPPPFFDSEFKERLEVMNLKIKEKEKELKTLEEHQEKKKGQLQEIDNNYYRNAAEKNKLEVEVKGLSSQKEVLALDVKKSTRKIEDEESKVKELRDFVSRLQEEDRTIKETIVSHNMILADLKNEREKKSNEIGKQRILLANLHLDTSKLELKVKDATKEFLHHEEEIQLEQRKVEKILHHTETATYEAARIQHQISELLKEKTLLDHDVNDLQKEVSKLDALRKESYDKLQNLNNQINVCETHSLNIQEQLQRHQEDEKNLKNLNVELHSELAKVEGKLGQKKNQLNQVDFQNQDAIRKLSTVMFELERAGIRLKELSSEEKAQELKMLAINEDFQVISQRAMEEKKIFYKNIEDEKKKSTFELNELKTEISEVKKTLSQLQSKEELLKIEIDELNVRHRNFAKEKQILELQVNELKAQKTQAEDQIQLLKNDTVKFEHDKNRAQRELSQLQIKMMECETRISERHEEAHLELENFKREERAKIASEKNVYFSEMENFKQKSLIEVENEYRKKLDDLHIRKLESQAMAEEILKEARLTEAAITNEATNRLKEATSEAQEREVRSHNRIKEAQEYFKTKELEADAIIQKSRLEASEYQQKTETELMTELSTRKLKIKQFLTLKQEAGLAHIKAMNEQHILKMNRTERKAQEKLEEIKRKELKRIARLRDEEISSQKEMKEAMLQSLKAEREKTLSSIQELKNTQEAELAAKKKTVLEHINSSKFTHQQSWEKELQKSKEEFNRSKKARILNATQAVMNVVTTEIGNSLDKEQLLKERIQMTLEMAIDGQNAGAMKEVNQILDLNPMKRKQMIPVLKKYAWQVGVPAAVAIIILADVASVRTFMVESTKKMIKQHNSASEMYVNQQKTEWKEKHTFNPETTVGYKPTYVENILYTTNFEKVMENEEFQNDWILKIHEFMTKELEVSEDVAITYISSEGSLLKDLSAARKDLHPQFLDKGLEKLNELEKTHLGWLKEKIPDQIKMDQLVNFRKEYFDKYYSEKFLKNRVIASDLVPSGIPGVGQEIMTPVEGPLEKP